jgi:tetratricopeptide (TPR) repeat protein
MIQKWLVTMSLSIFLLTGLSTSSFFLADFLSLVIQKNEHTTNQLNFALTQENEVALLYALQNSEKGSKNWQNLAKKLARNNGKIAYSLAEFYLTKKQVSEKLSSQFEQATLWYQQAIRLNYPKASIALAELYFQQGDDLSAQNLMAKLQMRVGPQKQQQKQKDDIALAATILSIKMAISIGDITLANSLLIKYLSLLQADERGALLLNDIEKYQVLPSAVVTGINRDTNGVTCPNSIQLFATNLLQLDQVEQLVERFKNQPLNDFVCFSPVRYLPLSTVSCSSTPQDAILCDEAKFDKIADSVTTRYIAIMLPKGGANVHFGMLYFDAKDSIDVIEHEISHLLGFVDEYPLSKGHSKCRTSQQQISAQNIAVLQNGYQGDRSAIRSNVLKQLAWAEQIKNTTPILHLKDVDPIKNPYWQLGTSKEFEQEVGLFRAETCDNNSTKQKNTFSAFKPILARTKLQYDELNFPKEYIALLQKNSEQFLMPSFHYNIALAYYQQNKIQEANDWLEKAISWEVSDSRREKVQQGDF